MLVIWPAFPPQSTQRLPCVELKPRTGWLNTLYMSKRNCALTLSVKLKLFASDRSEKKARRPRNELRPSVPICAQAGRAKGPAVGRANVQVSVVGVTPV